MIIVVVTGAAYFTWLTEIHFLSNDCLTSDALPTSMSRKNNVYDSRNMKWIFAFLTITFVIGC